MFFKNGYTENLINKYFKEFVDKIHVVKQTTLTVAEKNLVLVLPYLKYLYKLGLKWKSHWKTFLIVSN